MRAGLSRPLPMEADLTEIGRRIAILAGTGAFTICVLIGIFTNGDLVMVFIYGLVAALIFGIGGLLIGNLTESYIVRAARREVTRRAIEHQLAKELSEQNKSEGKGVEAEEPGEEVEE
jgi:hypothetical protein